MDFLKLCADRYSVRSFDARPVPSVLLDRVLEAGRLAPSARNRQPTRIYVVRSPEAMGRLLTVRPCFGAPVVLAVCGDTEVASVRQGTTRTLAEMDVSIAATHMMLAAASLGLGTVWVCAFDQRLVTAALRLPERVVPYLLLPIGYPADDAAPSALHADRKPLSEIVTTL